MATYDDLIFSTYDLIFERALDYLKHGYHISREGWNGKGMYIVLDTDVDLGHFETDKATREETLRFNPSHQLEKIILLKTVRGHFVPWCPSQTDLLAEDWFVYD